MPGYNLYHPLPAASRLRQSTPTLLVFHTGSMRRPRGLVIIYGLLVMLVLCARAVSADGPGAAGAPAPMVKTALVQEQDVNPHSRYVGHVEAVQSVELRARVEGFLEQVNFREGSDVKAGDVLYIIEKGAYQTTVESDRALVAQSEAVLDKARQFLNRARALRSGAISATDLDNALAEEKRASAVLSAAKAHLQRAEIDLGYTVIKAPISGRIGRTAFTRGNLVNPGSGPLARIVQLDPIRVNFSISENDLAQISMALKDSRSGKTDPLLSPRIELSDGSILETAGRVDFVDNAVDPATGTIAVWVLFDNPGGVLLPGQYVRLLLSRSKPRLMPVVPQASVLSDKDGHYVLVVDAKNVVEQRRVTTGAPVGPNWAVEEGIKAGETVIVEGVQKARPGQSVKTVAQ